MSLNKIDKSMYLSNIALSGNFINRISFDRIGSLLSKSFLSLIISCSSVLFGQVLAENGFLGHCIGPFKCATGGAGVASATSAVDGLINPALISRQSNNWLMNFKMMHVDLSMDTSSAPAPIGNRQGKQKSTLSDFPDFSAGISYNVNDELSVALAMTTLGGAGSKYRSPRTNTQVQVSPSFDTTAMYRLIHLSPTVSWNVKDDLSIGVSLILGYSDFKTDSASAESGSIGFVQTNGNNKRQSAFGYGARFGALWDVHDLVTLGVSYATPVWFKKFTKYNDIFLGAINTPMHFAIGSAWHITPDTDFLFDIKQIFYKRVKALGTAPVDGGFGWSNQTVFMIGVTQSYDKWSASIGYNYAKSPIAKDKTFANVLFPAIVEQHFTAGVGYKIMDNVELRLGGFYAPRKTQVDPGTGDKFSQIGKDTRISVSQYGVFLGTKCNF